MSLNFITIFIFLTIHATSAKLLIIPDTKPASCEEFLKGQEIDLIDTSSLEIIRVNETHSFYKGTIKFLKDFSTFPGRFLYEKYNHGEWSMFGFDGKYGDFCRSYHDQTQPFYYTMNHFPKCPIQAGTEWSLDMVPFTLMGLNLDTVPPQYIGRWRMITIYELKVDKVRKYDCKRIYFEIVDTDKSKKSSGAKAQRGG